MCFICFVVCLRLVVHVTHATTRVSQMLVAKSRKCVEAQGSNAPLATAFDHLRIEALPKWETVKISKKHQTFEMAD